MSSEQNAKDLFLVTGATGKQGGAVARHLLERGFHVRALTREPQKLAGQTLAGQGVEVVRGDFDDRASLERALEGVYGVFSVQNFFEADFDLEVRQGRALADAAKTAGVQHFVYSSVGSAHRKTGIPHFDSKWQVEEHLCKLALPYTLLRPVFFMDNWEMMSDSIFSGTLAQPLAPDRGLQQVCVDDIGAFAAMVFEQPNQWIGRALDIAGDELTMNQVAETFSRAISRPVCYVQVPWDHFRQAAGEELTIMYKWLDKVGYEADITTVRKQYPNLTTFERYLRSHGWEGAKPTD